jgi:hypothetical protein
MTRQCVCGMCLRARRLSGIIRDRQHADIKYMKPFLFTMLSFINWKDPAEYTMITALAFLDIDSMEYLLAHLKKREWDDDNFMEKLRDNMKYTALMLCENNRPDMCRRVLRLAIHPACVVHHCLLIHTGSNTSFVNVCDCVGAFGEFYHIHRHYCPEGWNAPGRLSAQAFLAYFNTLWKSKCYKALLRFVQQEDRGGYISSTTRDG